MEFDELKFFTGMTAINNSCFLQCSSLRSITIPDGLSTIDVYAFRLCSSLEFVNIPNSVTTISKDAYSDCLGLKSISLTNVRYIKEDAFKNCKNLEIDEFDFPNLCELGQRAFIGVKIKKIVNLGSITVINPSCFEQCTTLTDVVLSDIVTAILGGAFRLCSNLVSIRMPDTILSIGEGAFWGCAFESIKLPNHLTEIGKDGFVNCSKLLSITIPSNVIKIGDYAIRNSTALQYVKILAEVPPTLGNNVFDNTNNCPIYVPATSVTSYKTATNWSNYASRIKPMSEFAE